jgi:hypothetical protein
MSGLTQQPFAPKPKKGHGTAYLIAGLILGPFFLIGGCMAFADSGKRPDGNTSGAALVACHNEVKAQLKAPATAKFHDRTMTQAGSSWQFSGTVDAQNGFGALLTLTYSCSGSASSMSATVTD